MVEHPNSAAKASGTAGLKKVVIATRESRLALWQAEHVKTLLEIRLGWQVELLGMTTLLSFVIGTLLGGIGRVFAAAAAAVFLGLIQSFSILVIGSRWQNLLLYGVLFAAILIFPRGVRLPRFRFTMLAGR